MHRNTLICLALAALLLLPTASLAQAATSTPRPAPTEKECRVCNEEIVAASTSTPTPQPAAHFWFFYDSGCDPCIRTLNEVLPPILASYQAGQVTVHSWDMAQKGRELRLALEQQLGRAAEEIPVVFIGGDMLAGDAEIQRDLAALIDKYLAQGGVDLPQALPTATPQPAIASSGEACTAATLSSCGVAQSGQVIIYFFWGEGCPHCADEKPLLERLKQQYSIEVRAYEVWYAPENQELFVKMAAAHGFEPGGVPATFIGERHWVGYNDRIGQEMEAAVKECLASGCPDAGQGITTPAPPTLAPTPVASGTAAAPSATPPAPTVTPASDPPAHSQSNGFALAIAIMVAMVAALIYIGVVVMRSLRGFPPRPMPEWLEWATPLLALIGLGVASYLAYVETQAVAAVCGPVGDCNAVQSSEYAKLLGVLPVGVLGALGYAAILAAWLWGRLRSDWLAGYAPLAILGMTLFGTLFSLYLTYLEPFVIRAVCAWCLTSAIVITVLMLLSVGPAMQTIDTE